MFCLFTRTDEGLYFYSGKRELDLESQSCFISSLNSKPFWKRVLCKALFRSTCFSDHRIHIKKRMAVLLNVPFTCVGIQCYDKYVCMCVESELLDVFSSCPLVLLFSANMATVELSLKSLLKAQPP